MKPSRAAAMSAAVGNCAALKDLQAKGVNITAPINADGDTALMLAAESGNIEVMELVISAGADVNAQDEKLDHTALARAVIANQAEATRVLLNAGADVNFKCFFDNTALYEAATHGHVEAMKVLLEFKPNVNVLNSGDRTPLHEAIMGRAELPDKRGFEIMKLLVNAGAHLGPNVEDGKTALVQVLSFALHEPARDVEQKYDPVEEVKFLVGAGADVNVAWRGITPLMLAAKACPGAVQFLIDAGAELNKKSTVGAEFLWGTGLDRIIPAAPPMSRPLTGIRGYLEQATQLGAREQAASDRRLRAGASVILQGFTALDIAKARGDRETVRILLQAVIETEQVLSH